MFSSIPSDVSGLGSMRGYKVPLKESVCSVTIGNDPKPLVSGTCMMDVLKGGKSSPKDLRIEKGVSLRYHG